MANNSRLLRHAGVAGEGDCTPMNSYDIEANYGPAFFDARHVVSLAGSYELPFGKDRQFGCVWNRAVDAVAGGWSTSFAMTAHTGFPITVTDGSNPSLQASRSTGAAEPDRRRRSGRPDAERWIDRAAFVSAPLGTFGDSGVGILRAPGYWNVDLSVEQALPDVWPAVPHVPRRAVQRAEPPELRRAGRATSRARNFGTITSHRQRRARRADGAEILLLRGWITMSTHDGTTNTTGHEPSRPARARVREAGAARSRRVSPRGQPAAMFLATTAAVPALAAADHRPVPKYRIVTPFKPTAKRRLPGLYPGRVVTVHSPKCIDEVTEKVDVPTVRR